ncbi:MAG: winged helix-turn-helix domain-containing protein [Chryseolinea sp.]
MFTNIAKKNRYDQFTVNLLEIDELSNVPKYKQVAENVVSCIANGKMGIGDRIPSITETSIELMLSRDTVEKAFKELCRRGIIIPVRGKGFYVSNTERFGKRRILLVFNKLSDHKKMIYKSFTKSLGKDIDVDLQIHDSESSRLEKIVIEGLGKYDYYVIMPLLQLETESVRKAINKIPKDRLFLLNSDMRGITGNYGCVHEDFELDIHQALYTGIAKIKKYNSMILVFPKENHYCSGVKEGFKNFCEEESFKFEIRDSIRNHEVKSGEMYIVIEDEDLVELIKKSSCKNLKLGKHVGIIAYNDSPFKEILAGGITVLSTDFLLMGQTMAMMVNERIHKKVKNPFTLTVRGSI